MGEVEDAIAQFRQRYEEARKAHPGLPDVDSLHKEWDILEAIGRNRHFPVNVLMYTRWYMMQAINGWASYLHEFILPNQANAVSMEEYNYFNDVEKKDVIEILNWIMYCNRAANVIQLDENDGKTVEFIQTTWKLWLEKKKKLKIIIQKNSDIWKEKVETK